MSVTLEAGLVGRDPDALCGFYTGVMRFALVDRTEYAIGVVYKFRRDDARLKIFFSAGKVDPVVTREPWYAPGGWRYAAITLERLDDVDDLAAAVGAQGGSVVVAPTSHRDGARMAVVSDPEGNVWELLAET